VLETSRSLEAASLRVSLAAFAASFVVRDLPLVFFAAGGVVDAASVDLRFLLVLAAVLGTGSAGAFSGLAWASGVEPSGFWAAS